MKHSTLQLRDLISLATHIGRNKYDWNVFSERFLIGYRNSVSIFNSSLTHFHFRRALNFVTHSISRFATGFFFGLHKTSIRRAVHHFHKLGQIVPTTIWHGGILTNLRRFRTTVRNSTKVPSFVVCFYLNYDNWMAVGEKSSVSLPIVTILDSNIDVSHIEYPIPGSSSGGASVSFFSHVFLSSVQHGLFIRFQHVIRKLPKSKKQFRERYVQQLISKYGLKSTTPVVKPKKVTLDDILYFEVFSKKT